MRKKKKKTSNKKSRPIRPQKGGKEATTKKKESKSKGKVEQMQDEDGKKRLRLSPEVDLDKGSEREGKLSHGGGKEGVIGRVLRKKGW